MMNLKSSKKYSLLLAFTLLMATFTLSAAYTAAPASAQAASDWPMFRYDPARTGFNPTSTAPCPFKYGWIYKTGASVRSSPAVVGGKVYIGSDDAYIYCLDGTDGSLEWKYKTGGAVASSPAVVGGKVYVGSFDNYVYCLDADDGSLVWKYKTGHFVYSSPCVVDGKVYINSNDKKIYCLDAATGDLVWNYTTRGFYGVLLEVPGDIANGYYSSSPAVVGGKVYVGSFDNYVYCLDADDGSLVWEYQCGAPPPWAMFLIPGIWESTPCVANDVVYVGSHDSVLYAINATTGTLKWGSAAGITSMGWWIQSSAAFAYGKLYVTWPDHTTKAQDPETGEVLWSGKMGIMVRSSPSVADGKVYNGNNDRRLYCWDAETGKRLQSETTASAIMSSPAIADGKVYIGGTDGNVYCYVEGTMKSQDTLGVMAQPRTIPLGKSVTVSGAINTFTGFGPSGATVTLTYTKPDGTTLTRNVTTGDYSAFTDTYTPDAEGKWAVKASWPGNPWYLPAESWYEYFTVTAAAPVATTISCTVSPASVTVGESATVSGSISPAVSGATVTLNYTKPDGTTITRTVTSGTDGSYTDTYTPDVEGSWSVKSSWPGSATHAASTSTAATVTVTAAAPAAIPIEYIYGIAAVIAIAIIAVAAYWYMKRKK